MYKNIREDMASTEKLAKELKQIISDVVGVSISSIKESTDLRNDLGMDSFTATETLVVIEQKYGLTLDPAEAFKLNTFADAVNLVKKSLKSL